MFSLIVALITLLWQTCTAIEPTRKACEKQGVTIKKPCVKLEARHRIAKAPGSKYMPLRAAFAPTGALGFGVVNVKGRT